MSAPKFKVGDKVRVVSNSSMYIGEVGVIDEVRNASLPYRVQLPPGGVYFAAYELELEPDIEKLRQEATEAWFKALDYLDGMAMGSLHGQTPILDAMKATRALKAPEKPEQPEQQYRAYGVYSSGSSFNVHGPFATIGKYLKANQVHVHPIDPETGLTGAELSPEELKALLEGEQ